MSLQSSFSRLGAVLLAAAAIGLTGCPEAPSTASAPAAASSLNLAYDGADRNQQPLVGEQLQLRLQFAGQAGEYMMGALIDRPPERVTTWHAEPADAVRFHAESAKAEFLRAGQVRIWATYTQDGQEMRSNEVTLTVAAPSQPAAEPAGP